jgi:Xaa-Pro aminopeptidase
MITSNEPGLYFEGKYGIRIENEILCYEEDGICKFESITLCPYEKDAMDMEMLTDQELDHINNYHKKVYELVLPLVDEETKAWLDEACAEIQR